MVCAVGISMMLNAGCSSSEETGAGRGAGQQEKAGPILPEQGTAPANGTEPLSTVSSGGTRGKQKDDPAVRRGRDTVTASTQRVPRSHVQRLPLIKPPDAMYTVQVGAYRRAPFALALQKTLKSEHGEQPVFNLYTASDGMYRVTVGKFETLKEATKYRNKLAKEQPKRYGECWVTYIERSE